MNPQNKNPKTYGISYSYWIQCLEILLEKNGIKELPDQSRLHHLYHADCSPFEVYQMVRTKTIKSATLTLRWFDKYEREEVQFTNNDQIKHFYRLNPDIKRIMETKKWNEREKTKSSKG